jgi:endonuclease/exonuclease/phosphatase family metal-dependent hydrolase
MSGTSLHLGFNTASNVWKTVSIPATGGWQTWTTVSVPVTLGPGRQQITVMFDNGGVNLDYIEVTSGSSSTTPPPPTTGGSTLPVVTWNVKVDGSATHAQGVIDRLMALTPRPQVVVLEEAMRSQLNTYLSRLQTTTGQTWRGIMATHCPPGAWNGSSCSSSEDEGVVVLTPLQVLSSSTGFLGWADQWHSARGFVRVAVNVGGLTVQVFGVHLQPNNATARNNSMGYLKSLASNYSGPKIMAGDFNAGRDQVNVSTGMAPAFLDCWNLVGSGAGNTAFTPSPSMVIDFWLTDASKRAMPTATRVVTETGTFSDHLPVFTTFSVK